MDKKRNREEWCLAILSVIERHGGVATYSHFYKDIPEIFRLTERELRPSTDKARHEPVWRGTLRGYLCDFVQSGAILKSGRRSNLEFSIPE